MPENWLSARLNGFSIMGDRSLGLAASVGFARPRQPTVVKG